MIRAEDVSVGEENELKGVRYSIWKLEVVGLLVLLMA